VKGPSSEPKRSDRVAERLRVELSELLLRGRLRDPGAKNVLISEVKLTDDLSQARIYLRTLDEADARRRDRVVAAFERAAGFLRKELAPKLKLRRVPELRFFWDDLFDRAMRIEAILSEAKSEASLEPRLDESSDGNEE